MGHAGYRYKIKKATGIDPGPHPAYALTTLTVVVIRPLALAIDDLYERLGTHYATRNDFLNDLLVAGLAAGIANIKKGPPDDPPK